MRMVNRSRPAQRSHPLVARMWDRMSRDLDEKGFVRYRRQLVEGLNGRVIEIGAGNGRNFPHYPPTVQSVVAVEPEPHLRRIAQEEATKAPVPIEVRSGTADVLPGGDEEFDAAVVSLVLCLVPDVDASLAEISRVIRPGGEVRFLEHVRARRPWFARAQRAFDVVWPRVNGWGCHASRDTASAIEQGGLEIERMDRFSFRSSAIDLLLSPHVIGTARRAGRLTDQDGSA